MWASLALFITVHNSRRGIEMKKPLMVFCYGLRSARVILFSLVALCLAAPVLAQTGNSPWENAVNVLQQAFTSTIARGLSLVAIVVSGLVRIRRGRIEARPRWRSLRRRNGHCRGEFPGMALSRIAAFRLV